MKLAVMQPYFFPYIGYFQLMSCADEFIIYDNIKNTKKGWINRNRILRNGKDIMFSVPLKSASDSLDIVERELAADFQREKLLAQIEGAYRKAPFFSDTMPLVRDIISYEENNLFAYLFNSLRVLRKHLNIDTQIIVSSDLPIDHSLRAQDKVLAFCSVTGADTYINAIGGVDLYDRETFAQNGIELKFLKSLPFEYKQFGNPFVPWLSIIDVLMFNPVEQIGERLATGFEFWKNDSRR